MIPPRRPSSWLSPLMSFALCLSACGPVLAQEAAHPVIETLEGRVSKFLEAVSLGETQTAYPELLAGSQLLKQTDALKTLTAKTNDLKIRYGRYHGFERIVAHRVGKDLVLLFYLYKCENHPVVWYFTFYRPPSPGETPPKSGANWRVIGVRFDTDLEGLVDRLPATSQTR